MESVASVCALVKISVSFSFSKSLLQVKSQYLAIVNINNQIWSKFILRVGSFDRSAVVLQSSSVITVNN